MILAILDIVGIQRYVFASNRMKENVGASLIVELALSEWLPSSVTEAAPSALVNWTDKNDFSLPDVNSQVSIVYIGGGNALILFYDISVYRKVNQLFSKRLLTETAGELAYASAFMELSENNFSADIKELFHRLLLAKAKNELASPLLGIGISREGISDALPAVMKSKDGEYVSQNTYTKIEFGEQRRSQIIKRLGEYEFPKLLDDLGSIEGENYIAVVHIDGNDMGNMVKEIAKNKAEYSEALADLRGLSLDISNVYKDAFCSMLDTLTYNQSLPGFQKDFNLPPNGLIIRPLVINGDDITFVTDGRLGISMAIEFLQVLSKKSISINGAERKLSACAGIAIVKAHFPFYRAYRLAEELCASAKQKATAIEADHKGCWIDWHISQSGIAGSLEALREKHYLVPSMHKASLLSPINGKLALYNLLWRPWRIDGDDIYSFRKHFIAMKADFERLPRSRTKALRNLSIQSEDAVASYLNEMGSREHYLPLFDGVKTKFFPDTKSSNMTPYFDVIETSEMYYELKQEDVHG